LFVPALFVPARERVDLGGRSTTFFGPGNRHPKSG
jgi:hypothetical protein